MGYSPFGPTLLLALLLRPDVAGARLAAQEAATRPDRDAAMRLEQYKRAAGRYTIERHSDPPAPLSLRAEPVFRRNSPLRTAYDGVLYVWTAAGRRRRRRSTGTSGTGPRTSSTSSNRSRRRA